MINLLFSSPTESVRHINNEIAVLENESSIYEAIGKEIKRLADFAPFLLEVKTPIGVACFKVGKRGTFVKNGKEHPSVYVTELSNNIIIDEDSYPEVYLTCINPESNNYKLYHMMPGTLGIDVEYGRIGANAGDMYALRSIAAPYPSRMFWIRYYEKLSKGYVDQSEIFLNASKPTEKNQKAILDAVADTPAAKLYHQLLSYAKTHVHETLVNDKVTHEQVSEATRCYKELCKKVQVAAFNRWLMKLLVLCPRRTYEVKDLLAVTKEDFSAIIDREETLLNAMSVLIHDTPSQEKVQSNLPEMDGIKVFVATEKQKEKVLSRLSDSIKPYVKNIYRVIPEEQKKKFDDYVKKNNIKNIKEFWHGSKNENWLSILTTRLMLNPNAQITGKMFGEGIYFASSSMKSWGYTSFFGSRWANGNQASAFMGLYAVAYGNPYICNSHGAFDMNEKKLKSLGPYDCLHAKAVNTGLREDEIIFYNESAVLMNYIVEFAA